MKHIDWFWLAIMIMALGASVSSYLEKQSNERIAIEAIKAGMVQKIDSKTGAVFWAKEDKLIAEKEVK